LLELVSTHAVPHAVAVALGHLHSPPVQRVVPVQTLPQLPQLFTWLAVSTHVPSQHSPAQVAGSHAPVLPPPPMPPVTEPPTPPLCPESGVSAFSFSS
jgi:hypothetical protein